MFIFMAKTHPNSFSERRHGWEESDATSRKHIEGHPKAEKPSLGYPVEIIFETVLVETVESCFRNDMLHCMYYINKFKMAE